MTLSRLDLDGAGSPVALVARILELEPDLPLPIPIEDLCRDLDITSIETLHTDGFEAALVTDTVRSSGAILVAANRTPQRTRFSIAHELGHFLIPTHKIPAEGTCSARLLTLPGAIVARLISGRRWRSRPTGLRPCSSSRQPS